MQHLLQGTRVQFRQGSVTEIDAANRRVNVQTPDGTIALCYDRLVYALGSSPDRGLIPGADQHTYTLNAKSAQELAARVPSLTHLMIVGGGLTAIEAATEMAERHPNLRVEVLMAEALGAGLSEAGAAYLRATFAALNITVREGVYVKEVRAGTMIDSAGTEYPFEAALWLAGFKVSPLAQSAGLAVNERGQMRVDEHLQSISHPEIYAAGDAAAIRTLPLRMACATAMPMAAYAADAITAELQDKAREPFQFGYAVRCISLGRRRGLVQVVASDDSPRERIITGRAGALVKEGIVRGVMAVLRLERIAALYAWPRPATQKAQAVTAQR
jgi:NADH:ubiquinone reductase (H+-translocating)